MSLDTQIKALLESDEPITEDELIEETIEEVDDEETTETTDETETPVEDESDDDDEVVEEEVKDKGYSETILAKKGDKHVVYHRQFGGNRKIVSKHDTAEDAVHAGWKHAVAHDTDGPYSDDDEHYDLIEKHASKYVKEDTEHTHGRRENIQEDDTTKEHIDALLSGEELSEEFRAKATTIFEAALADGVKKQVAQLEEQYNEMLNDAITSVQEELVDKIDGYLNTIVEEWVTENQLAIERGVKADLVEEFIDGLKKLFNDHYVDIPEEKADILDEQIERLETVESELEEAAQKVAELEAEVIELRKLRNIEMVGEELTDSQFEKFLGLCEEVEFESEESFVTKIKTIKESYFPSKATVNESVSLSMDTPLLVDEKTSETINAYVKALSSPLTFKK